MRNAIEHLRTPGGAAERFRPPGSACFGANFFFMIGAWRSLVARLLREQEAVGSNPIAPTIRKKWFARTVDGVVAQPGEHLHGMQGVRGSIPLSSIISSEYRGVAQPGSASGLGPEGREFESLRPDHPYDHLVPGRP